MPALSRIATTLRTTGRTAARRLFLDRQAEFWLGQVDATRSLRELRARVVDVVAETADTKTFVLEPRGRWRGHRAGQFLTVEVELDGTRVRRCYSISSAPSSRRVAITVKRVPGGRVSGWLHDHVRPGGVLRISPPLGAFVMPEPAHAAAPRLLLLSGGSGITPVMSVLRDLAARDALADVVFVHHARSRADVIFHGELIALAARHPGLALDLCLDDVAAEQGGGGFDEARLAARVPDFAARATFLCGPAGLMARVEEMWARAGASANLTVERFLAAPVPAPAAERAPVRIGVAGRTVTTDGRGTLLERLERAGERTPSGCRIGICRTCTRLKRSGTVEDLLTGAVSSAPDESIQLCVSAPCSDVELA